MTETHPHMGSHSASGSDGTAMYSLAIAILLGLVILSASVYFGLGAVANTMFEKEFYSKTPIVVNQAAAGAQPTQPTQPTKPTQPTQQEPTQPAQRANIDISGRPIKGAKDAKVTIVAFSEYLCPYCRKAQPTMDKILTDYAGKVRIVPFPFLIHAQAQKMEEAGECALEQGEEAFWKMDSKLYTADKYETADLKGYAKELGLDSAKFDACLDSGKTAAAVEASQALGQQNGVGGTPSFFINGKLIVGAYPYDEFKKIIDAELAS